MTVREGETREEETRVGEIMEPSAEVLEGYPLAPQQRRLWRAAGEAPPACGCIVTVEGALDFEALAAALAAAVARHEALRTRHRRLPGMAVPVQVVAEPAPGGGFALRREPAAAAGADEGEVLEALLAGVLAASGSGDGPALRAAARPLGPARWALALALPALAADERTLFNLAAEAVAGAAGGEPPEAEPVQYVQFSGWQCEILDDPESEAGRRRWRSAELAELAAEPAWPWSEEQTAEEQTAGERAAGERDAAEEDAAEEAAGGFVPRRIALGPGPGAAALVAAAERCGATPRGMLLAVWHHLLARAAGRPRTAVCARCPGRPFEEMAGALGLYERWPPLALPAAERTVAGAAAAAERALAEAEEWQEYFDWEPLGGGAPGLPAFAWSEWPEPAPGAPVPALCFAPTERFGVALVARRRAGAAPAWGGAAAGAEAGPGAESGLDPGLDLELWYEAAAGAGAAAAARRLGGRFLALLGRALERPAARLDSLVALSPGELHRELIEWNDVPASAAAAPPAEPLHRRVAARAAADPGAPAVWADGREVGFGELWAASARLAGRLLALGLAPGEPVLLALDRCPEAIAGALGALAAGGAFAPVWPGQPRERLARLVAESGARLAIAGAADRETLEAAGLRVVLPEAAEPGADAPPPPLPAVPRDGLAYVLFTSGSTGRPKGVMVSHRSMDGLAAALEAAVYAPLSAAVGGRPLRVSVNAPLTFDASIKQLVQLGAGRCLCLVPEEIRPDGAALLEHLRRARVDVLDCTPAQLGLLLDAGLAGAPGAPLAVLVGGEAVSPGLWRALAADGARRYIDVYGPTECTVDATWAPIAGGRPTIGRPLPGVRVHVVGAGGVPAPAGEAGELWIGGSGVARGYLGRPAATAERFVPDPFGRQFGGAPGGRLYRTGDRVRRLPDGRLDYLGRLDLQVKLRGFRVELGEIEAALAEHAGVRAAAAALRERPGGEPLLVGYAVPRSGRLPARGAHRLPNGLVVAQQNRNETDYLYDEIFRKLAYARHGVRLPDDAVVLDVGANIGMFSLFVAGHRPRARILAFEPLPPIFATLEANAGAYLPGARLFRHGLAEREREERFTYYPRYSMMSGASAYADPESEVEVIKRFLDNERRSGSARAGALLAAADELLAGRFAAEEHPVHLRRLSAVLAEEGIERVHLLKIDVQRAELDVLAGLDDADWPRIDQIVMEVHDAPGEATAGRLAELTALLEGRGYQVTVEQDALLEGTDRHAVFALRPGAPAAAGAAIEDGEAAAWAAAGEPLSADELRAFLRTRLPEHMVPAALVILDELPLNRRGKLDRAALPAPEAAAPETAGEPPRTPVEEVLAALFRDLLGAVAVGREDSFFDLGGHSLLATQLMSRVRAAVGVELPLRALFEAPSVAALGERVERGLREGGPPPPPLAPAPRDRPLPLSFGQQRLWFLHRMEPASPAYNTAKGLLLEGRLDPAALAAALSAVVGRHEVLRTRFPALAGEPVQAIDPPAPMALPVADLSALGAAAEALLPRLVRREAARPFDLETGPVVRALLVRLGAERHALVVTLHHVACDGWSLGVLVRELAAFYPAAAGLGAAAAAALPALPVQYADYAVWQRAQLAGETLERQLAYWRERLAGAPPHLALPADRPRPPVQTHRGGRVAVALPAAVAGGLTPARRGPRRHPVHGAFGRLHRAPRALDRPRRRRRRRPGGRPHPRRGRAADRLLRQHPGAPPAARGRPDDRRADRPRARGGARRLHAPGAAVRAAGRRPGAGARPVAPPGVPGRPGVPERAARGAAPARPGAAGARRRGRLLEVRPHPGAGRLRRRLRRHPRLQRRPLRPFDRRAPGRAPRRAPRRGGRRARAAGLAAAARVGRRARPDHRLEPRRGGRRRAVPRGARADRRAGGAPARRHGARGRRRADDPR